MGYEEVLDGEEHWLAQDEWPGWVVPRLVVGDVVALDPQPAYDDYEGPLENLVTRPELSAQAFFSSGDHGWSSFSIMLQALASALDVPVDVAQYVSRDNRWKVTAQYHKVHFGVAAVRSYGSVKMDAVDDVEIPEGL